jgi:multiple sugar transport system ATP-binding protein
MRAGMAQDVRAAAEMLAIGHLLDRRPAQLSGGQRQRVALGRAVVRRPAAFLMDEPLSNLDAELRAQTRSEIVELHRRIGVTTVYVTHDQVEAMTMSDRVALMLDGRILQIGPPRALYEDPASLAVARFLGSPRISTLEAVADGDGLLVEAIRLPIRIAVAPGTRVTVGLRPEILRPAAAGGIPAEVAQLEYLGSEVLLHASFGRTRLVARLAPAQAAGLCAGQAVRLAVDWDAALLFGHDGTRLHRSPAMADA